MIKLRDVSYQTFTKEIGKKKIICIGAGQQFHDLLRLWDEIIISKICLVCDSNPRQEKLTVGNKKIACIQTDRLAEEFIHYADSVILITTMYCMDVYRKLESLLEAYEINCYVYTVMSLHVDDYIFKPLHSEPVIPKKIHYCWFGGNEMPYSNRKCLESWKKYCPDFEIIRWDESNYDVTKNQYMLEAYKAKKWGFVSDYARLDIVYRYGGIYLDTDVELIQGLDWLLNEDAFIGFQRNFCLGTGLGFGAVKNSEIIKQMREDYTNIYFINEDGTLNLKPCPYYQTEFLKKKGLKCNNLLQRVDVITVFPTDVLDAQGFSGGKIHKTHRTVGVHHYDEGWVEMKTKEKNNTKYRQVTEMMDKFENK